MLIVLDRYDVLAFGAFRSYRTRFISFKSPEMERVLLVDVERRDGRGIARTRGWTIASTRGVVRRDATDIVVREAAAAELVVGRLGGAGGRRWATQRLLEI